MRCWVFLVVLLASRGVRAGPRVVGLETDSRLAAAMTAALSPWHVDFDAVPGPVPGRDLDDAILSAHRVARARGARVVVWASKDPASAAYSLWIYDDGTRDIVVRRLPAAPPYDEETAAAVALTVKTVLRDVLEKPAHAPALETEEEPRAAPKPHRTLHGVRLAVLTGARLPTNASDPVSARLGAQATYFYAGYLGLGARLDLGLTPVAVQHLPLFTGTVSDTALVPFEIDLRLPLRRWLSLEVGAGPGVHFSTLQGSSPSLGLSGTVARTDLSLETTLALELSWKMLRIAPLVGASLRGHYERYRVSGVEVYEIPPGQMFYAIRAAVELP